MSDIPPPPTYPPTAGLPVPWHQTPPATPEPPVIYATFEAPQAKPESASWWQRYQLRRHAFCLAAVMVPLFDHGWSMATAWAHVLHQCKTEAGVFPAFCLAGMSGLIVLVVEHRGAWYARLITTVAVLGPLFSLPVLGALVYLITGVRP